MNEILPSNLKFTSQIFFCSYCMSMDTYKGCPHRCAYCFAQTSHGELLNVSYKNEVKLFSYDRALKYMKGESKTNHYIQQYMSIKQPLHIGGMSDPFPYVIEEKTRHSQGFIKKVGDYPCIWSTKNPIKEYAKDFEKGNHILQFSCIGIDDQRILKIEPGLPSPRERLKNLKAIKNSLKKVIVRFQPFIPFIWNYDKLNRFFDEIAKVANGVTVEFLKKPMGEKWEIFSNMVGININEFFSNCKTIDTSDKVFDPIYRFEMLKLLKKMIHERGMEFYSAENYFRDMGDSPCCCGISKNDGELWQSKLNYCLNEMLFKAQKEGSFNWEDIENNMLPALRSAKWVMGFNHELAKESIISVLKRKYQSKSSDSPSNFFANLEVKNIKGKEIYYYKTKKFNRGFDLYLPDYDKKYGNSILKDAGVL